MKLRYAQIVFGDFKVMYFDYFYGFRNNNFIKLN